MTRSTSRVSQAPRVLEDTWHMQCWEHQRGVCGGEGDGAHAVEHGECARGIRLWVIVMWVSGLVAASGWQRVREQVRTRLRGRGEGKAGSV